MIVILFLLKLFQQQCKKFLTVLFKLNFVFRPNNITVRFISEAQPSLRLKRLLDFGRFNDALEFAKQHDLSLDVNFLFFMFVELSFLFFSLTNNYCFNYY